MSNPRNVGQSMLQGIFSVFVGLVVVAFIAIAVVTLYPEPTTSPDGYQNEAWGTYRLVTSIILLVLATVTMVVSMIRSNRLPVLSNGVLLGGIFTMIYAVGSSLSAPNQWPRLLVIFLALVVTVGVAYRKFGGRPIASPVLAPSGDAPGGVPSVEALSERVLSLESKMDAIARAWAAGV